VSFAASFSLASNASTVERSCSVPVRLLRSPTTSSLQSYFVVSIVTIGWSMPSLLSAGPMQVLRYLGRYTHRVAISNHRLLAFDQERVTFRWKDYAHGGNQGQMTLAATEFLRRFFLHVLPKGFVRIRHFGFLANRFRASRLALSRQLLASGGSTEQEVRTRKLRYESSSLWHCLRCGASMIVIQRFTATELSACLYFDSS
jgi:Putative transposase